jgi:large conductance mechanosensitive channel
MKGFKQFLLRGNVVDLAIGVVIGAAFGNVVNSMVKGLLTPFIAAVVKQPDFSSISFTIHGSKFLFGDFVNSVVSFVIIAAVVYFAVVLPMNALMARAAPRQTDTAQHQEMPRMSERDSHRRPPLRPLHPARRLVAHVLTVTFSAICGS